jgi:hypothetical protein
MPKNTKPERKLKFTFGLWTVGNTDRNPFGGLARKSLPSQEKGGNLPAAGFFRQHLFIQRRGGPMLIQLEMALAAIAILGVVILCASVHERVHERTPNSAPSPHLRRILAPGEMRSVSGCLSPGVAGMPYRAVRLRISSDESRIFRQR